MHIQPCTAPAPCTTPTTHPRLASRLRHCSSLAQLPQPPCRWWPSRSDSCIACENTLATIAIMPCVTASCDVLAVSLAARLRPLLLMPLLPLSPFSCCSVSFGGGDGCEVPAVAMLEKIWSSLRPIWAYASFRSFAVMLCARAWQAESVVIQTWWIAAQAGSKGSARRHVAAEDVNASWRHAQARHAVTAHCSAAQHYLCHASIAGGSEALRKKATALHTKQVRARPQ